MSSFVVPKIMNIVAIASSTRKIPNAACKVRWDGFAIGTIHPFAEPVDAREKLLRHQKPGF
jgi:hypothetical protein